jgi:hypothetical protein
LRPTVGEFDPADHRRASPTLERRTEPSHPFGRPSQTAQPSPTPKQRRARRLRPLAPQSQLFFQSYESILPTSLTYILYLDKSFLSLGTCCGYWYGHRMQYILIRRLDFQGSTKQIPTLRKARSALSVMFPFLCSMQFKGDISLKR